MTVTLMPRVVRGSIQPRRRRWRGVQGISPAFLTRRGQQRGGPAGEVRGPAAFPKQDRRLSPRLVRVSVVSRGVAWHGPCGSRCMPTPPLSIPRVDVLGVQVSAATLDSAVALVEQWIRDGSPHYVCVTGVHGVMESRRDDHLRDIHNAAGLVTPDGMPLVWWARFKGWLETR